MKKQVCENCKWSYGIYLLECRRFPPKLTGKKVKDKISNDGFKYWESIFPPINKDYFCGEFKPSKKK